MRESRGSEHEGETERDGVDGVGDELARGEHGFAVALRGGGEERQGVQREAQEHQDREKKGAPEQEDRFHDLDPGRRDHASEEHVEKHHPAGDDHGELVRQTEEEPDEIAGSHHLGDEVEGNDRERPEGGGDAHRALREPVGDDVGEGVLPQVPEGLGDEEHHDGPAHEKSDGVDEPVEPGQRDQAGDAEKARGAHVVAGEREPVLESGDASPRGVEMLRGPRLPRRPVGDAEREPDESEEEADGHGIDGAHQSSTSKLGHRRDRSDRLPSGRKSR